MFASSVQQPPSNLAGPKTYLVKIQGTSRPITVIYLDYIHVNKPGVSDSSILLECGPEISNVVEKELNLFYIKPEDLPALVLTAGEVKVLDHEGDVPVPGFVQAQHSDSDNLLQIILRKLLFPTNLASPASAEIRGLTCLVITALADIVSLKNLKY